MDTFLILFTLDCSNDLEERYKRLVDLIKSLGTNYLEFTRNGWFLRTRSGINTVRDRLLRELNSSGNDGRLIIVDVGLVGWSAHIPEKESKDIAKWLMKNISGED